MHSVGARPIRSTIYWTRSQKLPRRDGDATPCASLRASSDTRRLCRHARGAECGHGVRRVTELTRAAQDAPVGARRQLLKSFRVLLLADLLVKALAIVTTVAIARLVGPSQLGALSLATALVAYVGVLGDGGLTILTTRRIVEKQETAQQLASVTTYAQLLLSGLLSMALCLVAVFGHLPHQTAVVLLALLPLLVAQA